MPDDRDGWTLDENEFDSDGQLSPLYEEDNIEKQIKDREGKNVAKNTKHK